MRRLMEEPGSRRLEVSIPRGRLRSSLQPSTSRLLKAGVIVLMLLALVWFARTLDWAEAWRAVKGTSVPVLIAAAVVNLLSVVLKAVRWWVFLRPIDVTSWPLVLRATF